VGSTLKLGVEDGSSDNGGGLLGLKDGSPDGSSLGFTNGSSDRSDGVLLGFAYDTPEGISLGIKDGSLDATAITMALANECGRHL
jgi:hypothetical protein